LSNQSEAPSINSLERRASKKSSQKQKVNKISSYILLMYFYRHVHQQPVLGEPQMDDLLLEVVVFLGTCAVDSVASQKICKVGILDALIDLLKAKQEDDEIVLQVVYVFHQLCLHEESRAFIIKGDDFLKFRTFVLVNVKKYKRSFEKLKYVNKIGPKHQKN
jgi:hypothetical protein